MSNKSEFAAACYDQNSIADLIGCLEAKSADATDLRTWRITATEYRAAIADALRLKIDDVSRE